MSAPLAAPGLQLPEEGWTTGEHLKPGLYWVRYRRPDGSTAQPAFCVVTPTGPHDTHAPWACTPNLVDASENVSDINYFVSSDPGIEFLPYTEEILVRDDEGVLSRRRCRFEIGEVIV